MAHSIEQPARQTVMQYSLRAIFFATLAVAILCGIVAPFLRNSPAFRDAFLRTAAMVGLGAGVPVAWKCWNRYRMERQCGALLLVVSRHRRKRRAWMPGSSIAFALLLLAFDIYINTELNSLRANLPPARQSAPHISIIPLIAGSTLANVFLNFWWKGATVSTELCENGVIDRGSQLISWNAFRGYRKAFDGTLQLLQPYGFITLHVPPESWSAITDIFDTHIPALSAAKTPSVKSA